MKTAFVTGGSSGIGQAIIKTLKQAGWKVIASSRHELDLSDLENVNDYAEVLSKSQEQIDVLIHVAGVWHDSSKVFADQKLENFTHEEVSSTMNVGLTSFMILAGRLLPNVPKVGSVIGVSGTFADGGAGWLPYFTSKRALEDFIVGLAQDYPDGPKVYGISPADTATPAYKKFYSEYASEAQSPEAIAKFCLQLIENDTDYKTGDIIEIRDSKSKLGFHS